jgi:hypothetical protein
MSLLADRLGYARLAEPVRFRELRERAASLRLRDGDTSVLAEYDQRGRIIGGLPEEMIDAAAAAYVALATEHPQRSQCGGRESGRAWPTGTCFASMPLPAMGAWSAAPWTRIRRPGGAGGRTASSCARTSACLRLIKAARHSIATGAAIAYCQPPVRRVSG